MDGGAALVDLWRYPRNQTRWRHKILQYAIEAIAKMNAWTSVPEHKTSSKEDLPIAVEHITIAPAPTTFPQGDIRRDS
ncbi:jg25945 [Pararge aegeria aegeria]|uniref:Jg25945 protein n=1 Tax=Pararge aegeria aegeria TaxID=348720 RepID=A0A8S4QFY8_9NEOP|nr:jg25945 [Pararge aegeria aegeria]